MKGIQEYTGGGRDNDLWGNLGAGGYSGLNEILMGLPDFLVKNVGGSDAYKNLQKFREEHKAASDIGGGLGFLGSMLIPAGGIAKLGAKGAKLLKLGKLAGKLDKAGDIAKMSTKGLKRLDAIKQGAKIGAVQALEQGIPRAITGLDKEDLPGSAMKGIKDIGAGALIGGALGGTLGRTFDRFGEKARDKISKAGDLASEMALSEIGAKSGDVLKYLGGAKNLGSGRAANKGQALINKTADLVKKEGLDIDLNRKDFVDKFWKAYEAGSEGFNKMKPKLTADDILPDIQEIISAVPGSMENVSKIATDMLDSVNRLGTAAEKRALLSKIIDVATGNPSPDAILRKDLAYSLKDKIKEQIKSLSDKPPEYFKNLDDLYPSVKIIESAADRTRSAVSRGINANSATQGKQLAEGLINNALAGAGIGVGTSSWDTTDPDFLAKKFMAGLGGAAAGGVINKLGTTLTRGGQKKISELGRVIADKLPVEQILDAKVIEGIPSKLAGAMPSKIDPETISTAATPDDQKKIAVSMEGETTPEQNEATKQEFNAQYKDTISRQLLYTYNTYYKDNPQFAGMSFADFAQRVKLATNNFDPVKSSKLLFPDDPQQEAAYLQKYNMAKYLKTLDAENILERDPGVLGIGAKYKDEQSANELRDLFINLAAGGDIGKMSSPALLKMVDEDLAQIVKAKGLRKDLLMSKLGQKYGLDLSDLEGMGVI